MPDTVSQTNPDFNRDKLNILVEATARHDRDAFAQLFNFYGPRVKAYLRRLNAADALAEELTQEVMLTVWRKAEQFDRSQASASTWIFRIARNRRIDMARRQDKPELNEEEPALRPTQAIAPDDAAHAKDRETHVRNALSNLPDEQVHLLQMAFFEGLSHRDIADQLGLPLGTVKSRLRLAFDKLRRVLRADVI